MAVFGHPVLFDCFANEEDTASEKTPMQWHGIRIFVVDDTVGHRPVNHLRRGGGVSFEFGQYLGDFYFGLRLGDDFFLVCIETASGLFLVDDGLLTFCFDVVEAFARGLAVVFVVTTALRIGLVLVADFARFVPFRTGFFGVGVSTGVAVAAPVVVLVSAATFFFAVLFLADFRGGALFATGVFVGSKTVAATSSSIPKSSPRSLPASALSLADASDFCRFSAETAAPINSRWSTARS